MSGAESLRHTPTSLDHLAAEVAAYPFASEASLAVGLHELSASMTGQTLVLWRSAERELLTRFPGVKVDELLHHRNAEWVVANSSTSGPSAAWRQTVRLQEVLRRTANAYLEPRGPSAAPNRRGGANGGAPWTPSEARNRWRWLARAMPPDLLLAALWSGGDQPRRVDLVPPQLAQRLLDEGFAEVHLHMGAGVDFSAHWAMSIQSLRLRRFSRQSFAAIGAAFQDGRELPDRLLQGALARQALASFLRSPTAPSGLTGFGGHFGPVWLTNVARDAGPGIAGLAQKALRALYVGVAPPRGSFDALRSAFAAITPPPSDWLLDPLRLDPLAGLFGSSARAEADPETEFVVRSLAYLDGPGSEDAVFARLFWQAVRVRCVYYRSLVMNPRTPGLSAFLRAYQRIAPGRGPATEALLAVRSARVSGVDMGLRSLEVRTSPYPRAEQLRRVLQQIEKALSTLTPPRGRQIEWGVVLHFLRFATDRANQDRIDGAEWNVYANPAFPLNLSGYRYEKFYLDTQRLAAAVTTLFATHPEVLTRLRAIDLCADETAIPVWVFVGLFRALRRASDAAATRLRNSIANPPPPLRCTVHVGEDFPHLLTGLRQVSHVLDYLPMHDGDRLGHALALGSDPTEWSRTVGRVRMRVEDRLFDLAWEWRQHAVGATGVDASRVAMLVSQVERLSTIVFGRAHRPAEIAALLDAMHDPDVLRFAGFPSSPRRSASSGDLLQQYLTSPAVYGRGRRLEWVDAAADAQACAALQRGLRRRVSQRGLAIEVNPSSNLSVGGIGGMRNHPLWALGNFGRDANDASVPVVVGSDDPITFATTLPDEYGLLHDALVEAGVSADEALRWVDGVRQAGLDFRFTLPRYDPTTTDSASSRSGAAGGPPPRSPSS